MELVRVTDRPDLLVMRVPPPRRIGMTLVSAALLGGGALLLATGLGARLPGFMMAVGLWILSWNLRGIREVALSAEGLRVTTLLFGLQRSTTFPLDAIVAVRTLSLGSSQHPQRLLRVDAGRASRDFDLELPEEEVAALAQAISERLPMVRAAGGLYRG